VFDDLRGEVQAAVKILGCGDIHLFVVIDDVYAFALR